MLPIKILKKPHNWAYCRAQHCCVCLESSCAPSASILSSPDTSKPCSGRRAVLAASQSSAYSLTHRDASSELACAQVPWSTRSWHRSLQKPVQTCSQSSTRNLYRQAQPLRGYFKIVYVRVKTVAADITQACIRTTSPVVVPEAILGLHGFIQPWGQRQSPHEKASI